MLHFHPEFPPHKICEDCGCESCDHHDGSCNNPSVPLIFETCNQNLNQLWKSSHLSSFSSFDFSFGSYDPIMDLFRVLQKFNPNFPMKFCFNANECKSVIEGFFSADHDEVDSSFLYNVLIGARSSLVPIINNSYSNGPQCDGPFEKYCFRTREDYKAAVKAHNIYQDDCMDVQLRNSTTSSIDTKLQKKIIEKAEQALEISENCLEAYNALALYKASNFEEALKFYKIAQEKVEQHYSDKAHENREKFEKTNKQQLFYIIEWRQFIRSMVGEANCLRKLGRYEEALECYRKCEQIDSQPHEIHYDSHSHVNFMYHIPECLVRLGRFKEALEFLKSNRELLSLPSSKVLLWTFALCEFIVYNYKRDCNIVEKYVIPECYHDEYLYSNAIVPAAMVSPLVYEYLIGLRKLSPIRISKTLRQNTNHNLVSETSQIQYIVDYLDIWLNIPGALDWAITNCNTVYAQMCLSRTEKELDRKYFYPNDPFKNLKMYSNGFFVNSTQPTTGKQLIHTAIDNNDREMIEFLISKGATIAASEEKSSSLNALYYVCERDKDQLLDFFISKTWVRVESYEKAFEICSYLGHWKCLRALFSDMLVRKPFIHNKLITACLDSIVDSTSFDCMHCSCKYCTSLKGFHHSPNTNFTKCIDILLMFGCKIEQKYINKLEDSGKKRLLAERIQKIQRGQIVLSPSMYGITNRKVLDCMKEANPFQKLSNNNTAFQTAEELKDIGNQEFQKGRFTEALKYYKCALEKSDHSKIAHILHSNISQCHLNLKQFDEALEHAEKGIIADPSFVKCYFRKALALDGLSKKKEALEAVELTLTKEPNNETFQKLKEKIKQDIEQDIDDDEEERICKHCGGTRIPRVCAYCGKEAKSKCGSCKQVRYCNLECQKKDWKNHKSVCKWAEQHHNAKSHYSVLAFLIFTLLQTITIMATAFANMIYNSLDPEPSIAVYFLSVVAILAMFCMCYFAIDAIVNENKMMIYSYIIISLFLMGRLLYGLAFGGEAEELLTLVPSLLICFFEVCQIVLAVPLVKSFGWKLYRKIGSGKLLHELYNTYHIFVAILKIDFVFTLIVGLLGFFFVMFDYWWVYLLFATGMICSMFPLFLIYKITILWLPSSHEIVTEWGGSSMNQFEIKIGLTLLSSFAFIVKIILMIVTGLCMRNFGKGLAQTFNNNKQSIHGQQFNNNSTTCATATYYSGGDTISVTSNALFAVTSSGDIVINNDDENNNRKQAMVSVSLTRSISDDSGFLGSSSHDHSSFDEEEVIPINLNHNFRKL